jgi:hypothetical protein
VTARASSPAKKARAQENEARGARREPPMPPHASPTDEKPMILKIGNRVSIEVSSFEDASHLYAQYRDASLEGASTFPDGTILHGTRIVARISYNAKVWPPTRWSPGQAPLSNPYSK